MSTLPMDQTKNTDQNQNQKQIDPKSKEAAGPATKASDHTPKISVRRKVTTHTIRQKFKKGEPISMLTAYDMPTAKLVDEAGTDMILVGDSLAMVVLGHPDTLSVTMDEMLHHAKAVRRGSDRCLIIGDMPFMSYQVTTEDAVRNAGRYLQESGVDAVKIEGGKSYAKVAAAIVRAGIPVQGHIGLTPQSVNQLGGWRVQGKTAETAAALVEDALALQEAGCFSIVLESVPERLGQYITEQLEIPTIGIGAGVHTSGQVLVIHDLLGLFDGFKPKFVKRYAEFAQPMRSAVEEYLSEVSDRSFPADAQTYHMKDEEWEAFEKLNYERDKHRRRNLRDAPPNDRLLA